MMDKVKHEVKVCTLSFLFNCEYEWMSHLNHNISLPVRLTFPLAKIDVSCLVPLSSPTTRTPSANSSNVPPIKKEMQAGIPQGNQEIQEEH